MNNGEFDYLFAYEIAMPEESPNLLLFSIVVDLLQFRLSNSKTV